MEKINYYNKVQSRNNVKFLQHKNIINKLLKLLKKHNDSEKGLVRLNSEKQIVFKANLQLKDDMENWIREIECLKNEKNKIKLEYTSKLNKYICENNEINQSNIEKIKKQNDDLNYLTQKLETTEKDKEGYMSMYFGM